MTFGDVIDALRRFWTVVVAVTVVAVVIAAAAATLPETKYEARATLLAQPDTARVDFAAVEAVRFLLPSLAELVSTSTFRTAVGERFDPPLPASAVDTRANFEPGTGIVHVTGTDANPARAQSITQVAARLLGRQQLSDAVVIIVLDPPERPTAPAGPGTRAYLVGGLVLGLLGGALVAILLAAAARARELALIEPAQPARQSEVATRRDPPVALATEREPQPAVDPTWTSFEPEPTIAVGASVPRSEVGSSVLPAAGAAAQATQHPENSTAALEAQLEELQLPVLGSIPHKAAPPAGAAQNGAHGFDDAFRALAARLTSQSSAHRQLLFTSPRAGAGRTTVVANTAWALATSGIAVVAVDADLDNPMLHRFLRVPREPGLTDIELVGIGEATHGSAVPALSVVPAGASREGSAASIGVATPRLLAALADRVVVLDGPPLVDSSGAATLARVARAVVVVLDASDPRASADVAALAGAGAEIGVDVVGVVLNRTSP